jgi:hypothetical protein
MKPAVKPRMVHRIIRVQYVSDFTPSAPESARKIT